MINTHSLHDAVFVVFSHLGTPTMSTIEGIRKLYYIVQFSFNNKLFLLSMYVSKCPPKKLNVEKSIQNDNNNVFWLAAISLLQCICSLKLETE